MFLPLLARCCEFPPVHNLDDDASQWHVYREREPVGIVENVELPDGGGKALRCAIGGGEPSSNVHCYREFHGEPPATRLGLSLRFRIDPVTTCNNQGAPSVVQAVEFSMSEWLDSRRSEFALQWENVGQRPGDGAPQWRYWDPNKLEDQRWVPLATPITQCLTGGEWHNLTLDGEIRDGRSHYLSFSIDGQSHPLPDLSVPPAEAPGTPDYFAVAVQLDGNDREDPYHVLLDRVTFQR